MNMNALSLNNYYYKLFVRINQYNKYKFIITNCEYCFIYIYILALFVLVFCLACETFFYIYLNCLS